MQIFKLAHELRVATMHVLAACRKLGIEVRGSALARLTPAQQLCVRRYFQDEQERAQLCCEMHAKLIAGVCPWCGAEIFRDRRT
jgi:hypothetical protein